MKRLRALCVVTAMVAVGCETTESLPFPTSPQPQKTLTTILLSDTSLTVGRNATALLRATASFSDGSTDDVTTDAVWTTENPEIVAISPGRVTGATPGRARVHASFGGKTASADVTVQRNITLTTSVRVAAANPRFTNIQALRASLDEKLIQQIDTGSDHAAYREMTIVLSGVIVSPGEHSLAIDVIRFGWAVGESQAATTTYTTNPPPVIQLIDADTSAVLSSIALPAQVAASSPEAPIIATFTWRFSVPTF